MADIKILVACHKPSELPQNDLFLPIQVGAKLAHNRLDMIGDDTGDNISDKNSSYCELTAQYWAWKNLQADYYGMCHYRRFLCFAQPSGNVKYNYRGQIEGGALNQFTIHQFGLDDSAEMERIITENDVVVGHEQIVKNLYTPRGIKRTAYQHWVAHDRVLIMQKDLDLMLDILEEVSPEVGAATREYLNGSTFLGFNCFVMKRELFQQMCEIEFATLAKLEERVDTTSYHQQLARIYGFMGEIISSGFIYYLSQQHKYRIHHVPLIYFDYTEAIGQLTPLQPASDHNIPIIFDYNDSYALRFGVAWRTFLDHINSNYNYDVLLLGEVEPDAQAAFKSMAESHQNVSLRFLAPEPIHKFLEDKYGLEDIFVKKDKITPKDDNLHTPVLPILPFILPQYTRALVINRNVILADDVAELWQQHFSTDNLVAAPPNSYIRACVNDLYYETAERNLSRNLKNPQNYFAISAFVWNFQKYRETISEGEAINLYRLVGEKKRLRDKEEILNILCEGDVEFTNIRWNTWLDSNDGVKNQLTYMPSALYQDLMQARKHPGAICFMADDPWEIKFTALLPIYWQAARETPFYESYLRHDIDLTLYNKKHRQHDIVQEVFPVGGSMRNVLSKAMPYGSKRYQMAKRLLELMRIR